MTTPYFKVYYIDYQPVSAEIKELIQTDHLGHLIYKKQKLYEYHANVYQHPLIDRFVYVNDPKQLESLIKSMGHTPDHDYILHHSSIAIVDVPLFHIFLEKVALLNHQVCLANYEKALPFLINNGFALSNLIGNYENDPYEIDTILEIEGNMAEKLRKETFYMHIHSSSSLIQFLHTNFEARHFNQIAHDELSITKTSEKKEKIKNEFEYYQRVPDELKMFFLPTYQYSETEKTASYKLEKLNIPDLSLLWVHGSLNELDFKEFLDKIFIFIKRRPLKNSTDFFDTSSISHTFYLQKLYERVEELKKMKPYSSLSFLIANQTPFGSLEHTLEVFSEKLNTLVKKKKYKPMLAFSHGDLCLSNILYDKRTKFLKLIDPRGASSTDGLYLDSYYDVAKLSHSILGGYDFINSGMFDLKTDSQLTLSLEFNSTPILAEFEKLFREKLESEGFDYELVRIFEVSLFLSMLPLHIDNPKKVLAFVLNAQRILINLN